MIKIDRNGLVAFLQTHDSQLLRIQSYLENAKRDAEGNAVMIEDAIDHIEAISRDLRDVTNLIKEGGVVESSGHASS